MTDPGFKALVVSETEDNLYKCEILTRQIQDLPPGDVLVKVHYSSLNYKDALSASGNKGVTRNFPHTPGIDAAGVVEQSSDDAFKPGDPVIVTSYDLGMNTDGGFGQYIRVPAGWVVPLPKAMSLKAAMCYGTAGFTAGLSVYQLIRSGVTPEDGEVLVTGATGGVGSIAVAILNKIGYTVVAVNGASDRSAYLEQIGAHRVISVEQAAEVNKRPLLKSIWAGCIDTVGGDILANALKSVKPNGVVTACGNAASPDLPINVYPFILRGVTLAGIDSQNCPMVHRKEIWNKLADEWDIAMMETVVEEIGMDSLADTLAGMLKRGRKGRYIVKMVD